MKASARVDVLQLFRVLAKANAKVPAMQSAPHMTAKETALVTARVVVKVAAKLKLKPNVPANVAVPASCKVLKLQPTAQASWDAKAPVEASAPALAKET